MPKLIQGIALTSAQRREVLNAYVYRFTGEHRPQWSHEPMPNGNAYAPTHATDDAWIDDHAFYINESGHLSGNHQHCEPAYLADTETTKQVQS